MNAADLKFTDFGVVEAYRKQQALLEIMAQNKCHKCPKLQEHYTLVKNQHILKERVSQLKYELSDAALQQMPDFGKRVRWTLEESQVLIWLIEPVTIFFDCLGD